MGSVIKKSNIVHGTQLLIILIIYIFCTYI